MPLTSKQRRFLRSRAHSLHPIIQVGESGLTEGVIQATDEALGHHELLKVRFQQGDKGDRRAMVEELCQAVRAELVQEIGRMAVIYRPAEEPVLQLPTD